MGYVAKTVPLSSALSVKTIFIVICEVFYKSLDLVMESFTTKSRLLGDIKRKTMVCVTTGCQS